MQRTSKKNTFFRVDGGSDIGMGHVIRCCALACMLKNEFKVFFVMQQPDERILPLIENIRPGAIIPLPLSRDYTADAHLFAKHVSPDDIVVLDGYHFDTAYQQLMKEKKCKLLCIDDIHAYHFVADAIINQDDCVSKKEYSCEPYTRIHTGMEYALLREPFLKAAAAAKRNIPEANTYFINMGGADSTNITLKVVQSLLLLPAFKAIHVLVGAVNPHKQLIKELISQTKNCFYHENLDAEQLCRLLQTCHVAICPASSISLEACAVGIGLISGYTASNQLGILETMMKYKTIVNFGDFNTLNKEEMAKKIELFSRDPAAINEQISKQQRLLDGKSAERIRIIFNAL